MTDYSQLKVAELKELVKERGIPSTGLKLKQQYVDALVANDDEKLETEDAPSNAPNSVDNAIDTVEAPANTVPEADVANDANTDEYEQDADNENGKRKRRSATPSIDTETVNKKLKAAEEDTTNVAEGQAREQDADVQQQDTSVTAEDDTAISAQDEPSNNIDVDHTMEEVQEPIPPIIAADNVDRTEQDVEMEDSTVEPSRHPATRALYIHGLVRPLQPRVLEDYLASIVDSSTDPDAIETCYLDKMKTHAFVLLTSKSAATRIRSELHTKVWPEEPMRKPLWIDYIPENKVQEWIALETETPDAARWEVVYEGPNLSATATLQELSTNSFSKVQPASTLPMDSTPLSAGPGQGMPGAPSGPRQRSPPVIEQQSSATFLSLDERFVRTEAKPRLYYRPIRDEQYQVRFDNLSSDTNPDWESLQSRDDSGSMRRYTFEDDKVVDSGPDFGIFGRAAGAGDPRGGRGGRGGYGRGGPRGRRDLRGPPPPRNGDYYAPRGHAR